MKRCMEKFKRKGCTLTAFFMLLFFVSYGQSTLSNLLKAHHKSDRGQIHVDTILGQFIRVTRAIPLISVSYGNKDTLFWPPYYPDHFLSGYKILPADSQERTILTNTLDTFRFMYGYYNTIEAYIHYGGWDYIDSMGNYFIDKFPFQDTLINYTHLMMERSGIFDMNGKLLQPLIFDRIPYDTRGENGLYPFIFNGKIGFIDSTATIVINPVYDNSFDWDYRWDYQTEVDRWDMHHFVENMCMAIKNHHVGVIDNRGNIILPFKFNYVYFEYEYINDKRTFKQFYTEDKNGHSQYFDKFGKEIKW